MIKCDKCNKEISPAVNLKSGGFIELDDCIRITLVNKRNSPDLCTTCVIDRIRDVSRKSKEV
jgi:hypothetical protein